MKWRPRNNYRNSRDYGDDLATDTPVSSLSLTFAWIADVARRRLKALVAPTEAPKPVPPAKPGHAFYSVLGLPGGALGDPRGAVMPCAFPERSLIGTERRPNVDKRARNDSSATAGGR